MQAYSTQQNTLPPTGFVGTGQTSAYGSGAVTMNRSYVSKPTGGVLKIIEIVLCLIVIICNNVNLPWQVLGGGWVNFVVILAIFGSAFSFFLHVYDLPSRMVTAESYRLAEFIVYVIWDVFWLIAGIVSAVRASQFVNTAAGPPVAACAFFCFASLVVYVVDTYFVGVEWRSGGLSGGSSGAAPYNNFTNPSQPSGVTVTANTTSPATDANAATLGVGSAYTTFASPSVLGEKPVY